jgi:D-alanyl-D-alanine carboxypeptidase/D-alanyl-D-alanine-endopeptidase (penicillin-binding protein 4)
MKRLRQGRFLLWIGCLGLLTTSFSASLPAPPDLRLSTALKTIIKDTLGEAADRVQLGIQIRDLSSGNVRYAQNATQRFTPASVLKIATAVAVLSELKPSYQFHTRLSVTGTVSKGHLTGDVFIRFSGDPLFTRGDLAGLVNSLKQHGVHSIDGHIILENTGFDSKYYPPGAMQDDVNAAFSAPVSSIIIDHNAYQLTLIADTKGRQPRLLSSLPPKAIKITNHVFFDTSKSNIKVTSNKKNEYTFTGTWPKKEKTAHLALAIRNPAHLAEAIIKEQLHKDHIRYKKPIHYGKVPYRSKMWATHRSLPLSMIIPSMLKHSDNLAANALFKTLGAKASKRPGSWQSAQDALPKILFKTLGLTLSQAHLVDGAGLSRYNLLSPTDAVDLLYRVSQHPPLHTLLSSALPTGGMDGTLAGRLPNTQNRIRAKTGNMKGVSALAGYIKTHHQGQLAFAIFLNGGIQKNPLYWLLEDRILNYLLNAPGADPQQRPRGSS